MFTEINATQETKGLLDTSHYQVYHRLITKYQVTPKVQKKWDTLKAHFTLSRKIYYVMSPF